VFHLELRQRPHVSRAFNLSEADLVSRFLAPHLTGRTLEYADREWEAKRTRLTILEGPELSAADMGLGRGWANAVRAGSDVTDRMVAHARASALRPAGLDRLKGRLVSRLGAGPLPPGGVVALADELLAGHRASQRLALAELAVWELLHERQIELRSGSEAVPEPSWQTVLLSWAAWSQATTSSISLARCSSDANR
jgi:hypothetical protein